VAVVALRKLVPEKMLILGIVTLAFGVLITLAGVHYQLFGTVIGGTGFGTVFSGTLRSMLPYAQPGQRAGLLSAYFVEGYLSFSLPALAAGFLVPIVSLTRTADFYGIGVILLAVTSLAITLFRGRRGAVTRA
jgi:hypothetical protein